ncbi:MAG: ABC transporter ATP-binding protein [Planctomycetota bacterium]|nr:ABC transporter ATP-binding protein [Planctomycetota bacterium]
MTNQPAALQLVDLEFEYPRGDVDAPFRLHIPAFTLAPGEQVLITARSGGGKSTLLSLIAGLLEPRRGRVLVDGRAVHELRGAARDRFRGSRIGMIFQTFNLLQGFSARENVEAALMFSDVPPADHGARAGALLGSLGIAALDRRVERLSVGQQQRVAVARALACGPALVLADEPTASLDPENSATAMELILNACRERGAAVLCVSHDPAMPARFARHERLEDIGRATGDSPSASGRARAGGGA